MKTYNTTPQGFSFNAILKFLGHAFKSIFQSTHDQEFKRLKDFIAS